MANSMSFYDIAASLLADVNDALADTDAGSPDRVCVVPGDIAPDACECGQLAITVRQQYFSSIFPFEAESLLSSGVCGPSYIVADMVIQILRCAVQPGDNEIAPSMDALAADAQTANIDAYVVRNVITCKLQELTDSRDIDAYILHLQVFLGPQGMCVGSELRFTVALPIIGLDSISVPETLPLRSADGFYILAASWADTVNTALANSLGGLPARVGVVAGEIAHDECECGQLATTVRRIYGSDSMSSEQVVPLGMDGACQPMYLVSDMFMDLVRCAPAPELDEIAVSCEVLDATAQILIDDATIMLLTTLCMLQTLENSYSIANFLVHQNLANGPAGMCVGSVLQMTVALLPGLA